MLTTTSFNLNIYSSGMSPKSVAFVGLQVMSCVIGDGWWGHVDLLQVRVPFQQPKARWLNALGTMSLCHKWHPIHCWLCSKVVDYIENRVSFGTQRDIWLEHRNTLPCRLPGRSWRCLFWECSVFGNHLFCRLLYVLRIFDLVCGREFHCWKFRGVGGKKSTPNTYFLLSKQFDVFKLHRI